MSMSPAGWANKWFASSSHSRRQAVRVRSLGHCGRTPESVVTVKLGAR